MDIADVAASGVPDEVESHPYKALETKAFWSPSVGQRNMFDVADLWSPKFRIDRKMRIATYGSCFAQHIGRALRDNDFNWMISEPGPRGLSKDSARKFNYGIFSARTGNIYTVSLLKQWTNMALGEAEPDEVWVRDGRYYDPLRPNMEPNGFDSAEEMRRSRAVAVEAFAKTVKNSQIFIFTLGLTESWFNKIHGYEYPLCPGTIVEGTYDSTAHEFLNQDYVFIRKSLVETIKSMRAVNPKIKFILTVSPVPLTATKSGQHVLVATMESKSILRAVAGSVASKYSFVDYFPSYEIINSPVFRGAFFEPNQREVNHSGVEHVMKNFFDGLLSKYPDLTVNVGQGNTVRQPRNISRQDAVCEEEIMNAFAGYREQ